MWVWMATTPWWMRWLLSSVIAAAVAALVGVLTQPRLGAALPWPIGVLMLALFGLAVGAFVVGLQQPHTRQYAEALRGLNAGQRKAVARALRRGDAPGDPAVVTAALRVGAVALSVTARNPRMHKIAAVGLPVLYAVLAVPAYLDDDSRKGTLWLGFAVLLAGIAARNAYNVRRLRRQMDILRSADPGDSAASAEHPPQPKRRRFVLLLALVVLVTGFAFGAAFAWWRPHTDCGTADAIASHLSQHRALLQADSFGADGPNLADYREWSTRLADLASEMSKPDLANPAHQIAAHAWQVHDLVTSMRAPDSDPKTTSRDGGALVQAVHGIVAEEEAMLAICD